MKKLSMKIYLGFTCNCLLLTLLLFVFEEPRCIAEDTSRTNTPASAVKPPATSTSPADQVATTPSSITNSPVPVFSVSYWSSNWPSPLDPPRTILPFDRLTNVVINGDQVTANILLKTTTNGMLIPYDKIDQDSKNTNSSAQTILDDYRKFLNMSLINAIVLQVKNKDTGQEVSNLVISITQDGQPKLAETNGNVLVLTAKLTGNTTQFPTNGYAVEVHSVFSDAVDNYARAMAIWSTNEINFLLANKASALTNTGAYQLYKGELILQNSSYADTFSYGYSYASLSKMIPEVLADVTNSTDPMVTQNAWVANVKKKLAETNAFAYFLTTNSLNCLSQSLAGCPTNLDTNDLVLKLQLVALLKCQQYFGHQASKAPYGIKSASDELKEAVQAFVPFSSSFTGEIIRFTNIVSGVDVMTESDAADNFGPGVADNFIVVSVNFQNTTTNSLLIYGDGVKCEVSYNGYTYEDPRSHRFLEKHVEADIRAITNGNPNIKKWENTGWGSYSGTYQICEGTMEVKPFELSLLTGSFDIRQFRTSKQRAYRFMNTAGNIASSLIPFVNSQNYANITGIITGTGVPQIEKFFGDMTDTQRQNFLLESMPQYLELKVGQSVNKYVYFPLHGKDGIVPNQVVYIDNNIDIYTNFTLSAAIVLDAKGSQ
jgi:hypothetical protein